MKLRRVPADFCVTEINQLPVGRGGPFSVYELKKSGWNTLDAVQSIAIHWKLSVKEISHAGLKDRHAITTQLLTIRNGPQRNLKLENISLEYLGQSAKATEANDIAANRFTLVLRSMNAAERSRTEQAIPSIAETGIANYFDDQRFGSYIAGQSFIAEHWIRGEYEKALWLTFAAPHPNDDGDERLQKDLLREHWGNWPLCKQQLSRSHRRSIITFLADRKDDFKGAWGCVNQELRGLFLTAFQSHLWNRILDKLFCQVCDDSQLQRFPLKTGTVAFPVSFTTEQRKHFHSLQIPLPSARIDLSESPLLNVIEQTLSEQGWSLDAIKVRFPRDRYFPKALRDAMIPVTDLTAEFAEDDLSPGDSKLTLSFTLPRGCYATMLVKSLQLSDS